MSDPAATAQRQQARQQGLIAGLITLPFRLFGVLCGSLLLSILIECIGMHWFWPQESWHHAQGMLEYELDQLSSHFKQSLLVEEPTRTAHRWVSLAYDQLFVKSGVFERTHGASTRARADAAGDKDFRFYLSLTYLHVESYALAAGYTLLTFLVRMMVLCLTLPLFIMAALVGLTDGLVRRDIRRFGAGRESGFVFHRAKASITPLAVLPWIVYLALPVSVHPLWILLPSAILLSIAVNITAASFKKYL
jgi:integrating conjugative element membrane protein (TIGR03747 family)